MTNEPDAALVEAVARAINPYQWAAFDADRLHPSLTKEELSSWERALSVIPIVSEACRTQLPDEIDLFRMIRRSPDRKTATIAKHIASAIRQQFATAGQGGGS